MATNKQAQIRYLALDKCFRNTGRKYFIDDLIELCSEALYNTTGLQSGVSRRQIFKDLEDMNTLYGAETGFDDIIDRIKEGRRVYYRYKDPTFSITSQTMTANEQLQLKESLQTLSRFKGFPQFEWVEEITTRLSAALNLDNNTKPVIEFEQNDYLKGLNYITQLYEAITYGKSLVINYKSFKAESATPIEFHPYYLKQFNLRWFLFGRNHEYGSIQNLSLDRIEDISEATFPYIPNTDVDFSEYFDDVVGVTVDQENSIQTIKLEVDNSLIKYIETKPLHESQRPPVKGEKSSTVIIEVIPNYELEALLLSFGEKVKVLEPADFKEHLRMRVEGMKNNYEL